MPKRASIIFAVVSLLLAFAACNNGSGAMTPTPAPTGTYTPNPKDRSASIEVTIGGTPQPNIPIQISTPRSSASPRPGTPFATQNTNKKGITIFHELKVQKTYCWVALLAPGQTSSTCQPPSIWQTQTIGLGT